MNEYRPYRQDDTARRRRPVFLATAALLAVGAAGLVIWHLQVKGGGRGEYSGKVVRISGGTQDVGLVKSFRDGRSITYYSAASGFKDIVFHRIEPYDSIRVIADSAAAYLEMKEREERALAGAAAAAEEARPDKPLPPPLDVVPGDEEHAGLPPGEQGGDVNPAPVVEKPSRREDDRDVGYARMREQGLREYEQAVAELAAKADQIDSLWEKYANFCQGTIAVAVGSGHGREWFGIYSTINAADTPECRMMIHDMQGLAGEIDAGMEAAWEDAHRSGVYPGQIRAVQQEFRMELDRWNK